MTKTNILGQNKVEFVLKPKPNRGKASLHRGPSLSSCLRLMRAGLSVYNRDAHSHMSMHSVNLRANA